LKADPFEQLALDPLLLVDVLWLICETQATERGVTSEVFGESLGDRIDEAVVALEAAVVNFFPASKRSLLQSLRLKNQEMTTNATTAAMETLTTNQSQIEAAMSRKMQKELTRLLASFDSATSEASESVT